MATIRKALELLPTSFDDGDISVDELLLLYDANISKNPDYHYPKKHNNVTRTVDKM